MPNELTNRNVMWLDNNGELVVDAKTLQQLTDEEGGERLSWLEYLRDRLEYGRYKAVPNDANHSA